MHRDLIGLVAFRFLLLAQGGSGSIQGTVTDAQTQKPIAGALVTVMRNGLPPLSQSLPAGPDGSYQAKGLPAGTYTLCAQVPGDVYLSSCQWTGTGAGVTLTAGQVSTGNVLALKTGSVVKVHLQDPGQFLNQQTKAGHDPRVTMGVWGPQGIFYPARLAAKNQNGADFQLTIP